MAEAIINRTSSTSFRSDQPQPKAVMLNKISSKECLLFAILLKQEDGLITIGDDRNIKIWHMRDNGQYWPSVCHGIQALPTVMDYSHETRKLFVGAESGIVLECDVADDYNSLKVVRTFYAHSSGVTCLLYALSCEWILTCARDKCMAWHCSESGRRLGSYPTSSWCCSLQFDSAAKYVFIGEYSGSVIVLRIVGDSAQLVSKLSAHEGSVRSLAWDPERQVLFSGSSDCQVIAWDIGTRSGNAYELQGHKTKIVSLAYASGKKRLLSIDDDGVLVVWDMTIKREITPEWRRSDICERCNVPFFWNVQEMWTKKITGVRQHHCRTCGRAICDTCSRTRLSYPIMGFEYEVRVCDGCETSLANKNSEPLAVTHLTKHCVKTMNLDEMQAKLITIGSDRILKIWDVKSLVR